MKKEPSLLTILGISVCLLTALYLSKNITNKTTYQGCKIVSLTHFVNTKMLSTIKRIAISPV